MVVISYQGDQFHSHLLKIIPLQEHVHLPVEIDSIWYRQIMQQFFCIVLPELFLYCTECIVIIVTRKKGCHLLW